MMLFFFLQEYLTPYCLANIESIPGEVLDSDCPYTELKDSLIQAFHYLSEMYQGRLNSLQEQLQRTDRSARRLSFASYTHFE